MVLIPSIAREFTDGYITSYTNTVGLTPVTYTFSDTQDHLKLYNNGSDTITFSVGTYSNVSLGRGKVWEEDVSFNSITLQANSSSQEFHILAKKFMMNDFTSINNSISSINTQLVAITPMNNNSTTYIYNPNGTVQSATQKDSTGNVLRTDSYTYDSNGNITQSITSMNGQTSTTTYTYDSNGNITGMSNALS